MSNDEMLEYACRCGTREVLKPNDADVIEMTSVYCTMCGHNAVLKSVTFPLMSNA